MPANPVVLITAIILDVLILAAFVYTKMEKDLLVVLVSLAAMLLILAGTRLFLRSVERI